MNSRPDGKLLTMHLRQAEGEHHSRSYFFLNIWYGVFLGQRKFSVLGTNNFQYLLFGFGFTFSERQSILLNILNYKAHFLTIRIQKYSFGELHLDKNL